ncbi:MAG: hypothetical protein M1814_004492 [Vezdaea aestivalis]|nr:MAG: hypothetical protein M1814_004492 [Vezdaea aestivalis]
MESVSIEPMTTEAISSAVSVIQDSFATDPYFEWVYPDRAKAGTSPKEACQTDANSAGLQFSKARNTASLTARCRWGMRHALFDVAVAADKEVVGVAMWAPPVLQTDPQTWTAWLADWELWARQVVVNGWHLGRGGLSVSRYWIWKAAQAEAQRETWRDRKGYYFLNIAVVKPGWQGKGIGKALMTKVLAQADREGYGCYLESSKWEPNVAIYRALGFEVVKEMQCVDEEGGGDACQLFCMIRQPKAERKDS